MSDLRARPADSVVLTTRRTHNGVHADMVTSSREIHDTQSSIGEAFQDLNEHSEGSRTSPADQGRDAWLFLAACFVVEALVWGFPFSFGIFQEYYSTHEPFKGQPNIAVIGTTAMGVMYIGAPLMFAILLRYPQSCRASTVAGLLIMCTSLAASSFSNSTTQLILSQGVGYAIGGELLYCPSILYVDDWFIRRKGLAYGVMWAGTGLAGFILPLCMQLALDRFGFRTILRAWSLVLFALTGPLLYFIKPRTRNTQKRSTDIRFILNPSFCLMQAGNILQGLGFFLPSLYLPSFASHIGAGTIPSTLTVVLFNVASVFGCIIMGRFVDSLHVTTCILISALGSAISVFLFWGLSSSLPLLYIFCVSYGLFAGSFSSTYTGVMNATAKTVVKAEPGMIFSMLAAGRGIGNIVSGPLSEALLRNYEWRGSLLAYGSGYGPLIVFTGVSMSLGSIGFVGRLRAGL